MAHRSDIQAARESVAQACAMLASHGQFVGSAGNVSVRVGDLVAITPTGMELAKARAQDITVVDLHGDVVEGDFEPTSELEIHLGAINALGAGAVVHTHAPWATAFGLISDELPVVHYQMLELGGAIPVVPFHPFGSAELAQAVGGVLSRRKAALLANHGAVTVGKTLDAAVSAVVLLEWACTMYMRAASVGTPKALSEEQQAAVVEMAIARGYGRTKSGQERS